mmetsp:Transcript_31254/g.87645  ORF Transcript_31254/g.87645 Transcript_31254/m.87645 type:complete len:704 (+) Transcript_31254:67-2178(+)
MAAEFSENDLFQRFLLISYASDGKLEKVKEVVGKGVDVNSADYDLRTPLHLAASGGHKDVVSYLLDEGAEVNCEDRWTGTPLSDAVRENHDEVAELLRMRGARILDMRTIAEHLCQAASAGDAPLMRRMLDNGADPNAMDYDKRTALHLASSEGHLYCVELLLDSGADLNASDRWANTPLSEAVENNQDTVAELLRKKGANLLDKEAASAALLAAVSMGNASRSKRLLENGAKVGAADYDDRTALHIAASEGYLEIVLLLLDRGANPNPRDRWGNIPLADAMRHGNDEVAELLRKRGSDEVKLSDEDEAALAIAKRFPKKKSESSKSLEPQGDREQYATMPLGQLADMLKKHSEWPKFTARALFAVHDILLQDNEKHERKGEAANLEIPELCIAALNNFRSDLEVQEAAALALWQMAYVDRFCEQIAREGGILPLVVALGHAEHLNVTYAASSALSNLTFAHSPKADQIITTFVREGGVRVCLAALRRSSGCPTTVFKCINCIWHVVLKGEEHLERVRFEQGMDAIVYSMKKYLRTDRQVVESGMSCIHSLIRDPSMCNVFVEELGGLELVISVLNLYSKEEEAAEAAISVICQLAVFAARADSAAVTDKERFRQTLMEKQAVPAVVQPMNRFPKNTNIQENGAYFFVKVARLHSSKKQKMAVLTKECKKAISKAHKSHPKSDRLALLHREIGIIEKEDCIVM